ncbi:MAG: hypothetical protein JHC41_09215, partial [Nitrosopumilus sp.]|nr:hypothetical protein [Nitrosopumilus sp.]
MNNEIKRKITSLTLMTIMLAGGMIAAAPSMVPAAHAANANLFVSAENSQFSNYMSGPQVIEVVVIDSDINDTDQAKGEPDVTINGKILRMVQAVDGNWYGYFADRDMATIADSTAITTGEGLDFGTFCPNTTNLGQGTSSVTVSDTSGVAVPGATGGVPVGSATGGVIAAVACTAFTATDNMNVIREEKDINKSIPLNPANGAGQLGINANVWPFIQLYTLNPTGNVVIQYNKGGGVQTTTLTFDTVSQFAKSSLDKAKYTTTSQVHVTLTDLWLNIDPTDEDSWTFGTNKTNTLSTNYQVFNENGGLEGAGVAGGIIPINSVLKSLMVEENAILILNADKQNSGTPILTLQDNDDSQITCSAPQNASTCTATNLAVSGLGINTQPITVTEQGPNSGIFGTYDESDKSVIIITDNAKRGTSASIDYNEKPVTVQVGFDFATVNIAPIDAIWTSGEEIPLTLVDGDANKNSRADEDLDLFNTGVALIPALQTGDPFTLGEAGTEGSTKAQAVYVNGPVSLTPSSQLPLLANTTATVNVQKFSERAIVTSSSITANSLVVDLSTTFDELKKTIRNPASGPFHGFNLLNLDVRSLSQTGTFDVYLLNSTDIISPSGLLNSGVGALKIASAVKPQSLTLLSSAVNAKIFGSATNINNDVGLLFVGNQAAVAQSTEGIAADFFSYGFLNDGLEQNERIANQVIRFELEETGDNTSTFAGTVEFVMITQLNILDSNTYTNLSPIANDPTFVVIEDLDDEESPRVNYNDLGADGVTTQVADQEAAPAHSGIVSLDANSYKVADTVKVTAEDIDLNVDSDLVDIYTVVTNPGTLFDAVGNNATSITLSNGDDLGRLLDITFDDQRWTTPTDATCFGILSPLVGTDTGLGGTGFTLVETGAQTGIFVGDFQIPGAWCRAGATAPETVTGLDIEVNYVDFRDASGEVIEVGDGAGVRANTGSVSLDRTVYPVPFGIPDNFKTTNSVAPKGDGTLQRSVFPIHLTGMNSPGTPRAAAGLQAGEFLNNGDLILHVRVNDPDFDTSATGEDKIAQNTLDNPTGPVKLSILRGSDSIVLGYAGGPTAINGVIDTGDNAVNIGGVFVNDVNGNGIVDVGVDSTVRQFGPMDEIAPDAGIFESDVIVRYTDGPVDS